MMRECVFTTAQHTKHTDVKRRSPSSGLSFFFLDCLILWCQKVQGPAWPLCPDEFTSRTSVCTDPLRSANKESQHRFEEFTHRGDVCTSFKLKKR